MKANLLITLLIIFMIHQPAAALKTNLQRWSLNTELVTQTAGTFSESYRLPGIKTLLTGEKGIQLGTEYIYRAKNNSQLFQNIATNFNRSDVEKNWSVYSSLGYRRFITALFLEAQTGIGYLQTTFENKRDLQNTEGNFYSEKFKVSGITPAVALGTGYELNKKWKIYLRYYHHVQLQNELHAGGVRLHRSFNLGLGLKI